MTQRLYFTCTIKALYMMKEFGVQLILALTFTLLPANCLAACEKANDMGESFYRCENKEAVCYGLFIEDSLTLPPISCFKKLTKN